MRAWRITVAVTNAIAALVTVPILSTALSQAVVVFCQRGKQEEFLGVRGMFVLSDRGWTNIPILWNTLRNAASRDAGESKRDRKSSGLFLLRATGLILLGATYQPVYQILVRIETISVTTRSDVRYVNGWLGYYSDQYPKVVGVDMEPAQMALIPQAHIRNRIVADLGTISVDGVQPNLWRDNVTAEVPKISTFESQIQTLAQMLETDGVPEVPKLAFFVASLPAGSATGVLREHLMRLNSSIKCEEIDRSAMPSPCPGPRPFTASLTRGIQTNISVCIPGNYTASPWTLSRNRQEHVEDMYIDIWDTAYAPFGGTWASDFGNLTSTMHCAARTTRGFFELGNAQNRNTYGPVLANWPSKDRMERDFNDWTANGRYVPSEEYVWTSLPRFLLTQSRDNYEGRPLYDPQEYFDGGRQTPGPLTMSALALFGNGSWLDTVLKYTANMSYTDNTNKGTDLWQSTCRGMPFGRLRSMGINGLMGYRGHDFVSACRFQEDDNLIDRPNSYDDLMLLAHDLVTHFSVSKDLGLINAENLWSISMFVANRALLTFFSPDVDPYNFLSNGRQIYTSPGVLVQKPVLSNAAIIVLSILISLQLLGLACLVRYIRSAPTWSSQLDSMALVRIGATLGERGVLPPIGPVEKEDYAVLETVQALVGIVESKECDESLMGQPMLQDASNDRESTDIELQLLGFRDDSHAMSGANPDAESQSVGSEAEIEAIDKNDLQGIQLALGAPGVITPRSV